MRKRRTRRRFLAALGGTGLLSGCLRLEDEGSPTVTPRGGKTDSATPSASPTQSPTAEPTEPPGEKATDTATTTAGLIDIAAILPLSGVLEDFGPLMRDAVELAVTDVNDAGGPMDRRIRLHVEDSRSDPEVTREVFAALHDEVPDLAAVVGPASSGSVIALAPDLVSAGVFGLTPSGTSPQIAQTGYDGSTKYVGRVAPNDAQQSIAMARVLTNTSFMGVDTAAFLHVDSSYGQWTAQSASERFDGETLQIVPFPRGQSDYSGYLEEAFTGSPDAVGLIGFPPSARTILKQWDNTGYGGNWVLGNDLMDGSLFSDLGSVAEGLYVVAGRPEETSGTETFESRFSNPIPFTHHAYDAVFLCSLAIQWGEAADGVTIARNLLEVANSGGTDVTVGEFEQAKTTWAQGGSVDYVGASSPIMMNRNLESIHRYGIYQVTDGQAQLVQEIPRTFFEGKY